MIQQEGINYPKFEDDLVRRRKEELRSAYHEMHIKKNLCINYQIYNEYDFFFNDKLFLKCLNIVHDHQTCARHPETVRAEVGTHQPTLHRVDGNHEPTGQKGERGGQVGDSPFF